MSRRDRQRDDQLTGKESESWHLDYKDSAYIYAGGLSYDLTEGDVVCIFSQYGEVLDINLIRDKTTGVSKGFAFLRYEDQRSTILAVDNLGGAKVLGRSLRVDHVNNYKRPKKAGESNEDWEQDPRVSMNVAPAELIEPASIESEEKTSHEEDYTRGIDPEDPMFEYLVNERREAALRKKTEDGERVKRKHRSHRHRSSSRDRSHRSRHDDDSRYDREDRRRRRRSRSRSKS